MTHCVVSNIPQCYKSANLRKHFKQYIENGSILCFHYRHRPEETKVTHVKAGDQDKTFCCVAKIKSTQIDDFIGTYHHKRWHVNPLSNGEVPNLGVAVIFKTEIKPEINGNLAKLPELSPPKVMPNGNVGTPTKIFRDMINKCALPPQIIKKLGLEFPRTVKRKQYSAVPPQDLYCGTESSPQSAAGTCDTASVVEEVIETTKTRESRWSEAERIEEHDGAEDWERHECFNNDVTSQERTKERLYEEEMEIVWDKGSSGLVFHTDANYWADLEGKDTDGLWTDEWDVDMGVYEGHVGDKDARDSQDMRDSQQFRKFGDVDEKIGDFEKHTKGFGSRMMRKQGWTAGKGLGSSKIGMAEPISTEGGQKPKDKTGLGYRGESICEVIRRNNPRVREPPLIGTRFDDTVNHKDSAIRSEDPTAMKYRRVDSKTYHKS